MSVSLTGKRMQHLFNQISRDMKHAYQRMEMSFWRSERHLTLLWIDPQFISFQSIAKAVISTRCELKYLNFSFHFVCCWELLWPIWYWRCVFHIYVAWFFHTVTFGSSFILSFIRRNMSLKWRWYRIRFAKRRESMSNKTKTWIMTPGTWRWVLPTYILICSVFRCC